MRAHRGGLEFGRARKCDRGASKSCFFIYEILLRCWASGPLFSNFGTPKEVQNGGPKLQKGISGEPRGGKRCIQRNLGRHWAQGGVSGMDV